MLSRVFKAIRSIFRRSEPLTFTPSSIDGLDLSLDEESVTLALNTDASVLELGDANTYLYQLY